VQELTLIENEGFAIVPGSATRTESQFQQHMREARRKLIDEVLPKVIPGVTVVGDVIVLAGLAFFDQVGITPGVHGIITKGPEKLKLHALAMDQGASARLCQKVVRLTDYFNASKHQDRSSSRRLREQVLNTARGKLICIDFFEAMRRSLIWYYRRHFPPLPNWDELRPIRYCGDYDVKYQYRLDYEP